MASDLSTVAVLGTGTMGVGMARSLLRAGHPVRAWNRNQARAQPLAADGATVTETAVQAVTGADAVLTMLFDLDAVLEVVGGAVAAVGTDAVWIQSATIGPDGMRAVAELATHHGLRVLDAPVLGTKAPAEQGKLVVLASGDPALRPVADPVFDAVGARTVWAGDELGQASGLKLACNAWVAALTALTAQSLALTGSLGLDPRLFLAAIAGGGTDSPYAHTKGATMLHGEYPASFTVDGVRKDVDLIATALRTAGVDPTLNDAVRAMYASAAAAGHGADDMAAVYTAFTPG